MSRITRDEDAAGAKLGDLTMMDAKIAAPPDGARLDAAWSALRQHLPNGVQRGRFVFCCLDRRNDSAARRTHRENCQGAEFARAELHLISREGFVGLGVSQH